MSLLDAGGTRRYAEHRTRVLDALPMATHKDNPYASEPRTVGRAVRILRSALDEMDFCLLQALGAAEPGGAQSDLQPSVLAALRNLLTGMQNSYQAVDELVDGAAAWARRLRLISSARQELRLVKGQ